MPKPKDGLTDKQKLFVDEYLIDQNATQACIRAGYSQKTANRIGPELLGKTCVAAAIAAAQEKRALRTQIDQDWVLTRLEKVYNRSMEAEPVIDRFGEPIGVYNFAHAGANRALETIARMQGLLSEKIQVTGKDGGPIESKTTQVIDPSTLSSSTLEAILADLTGRKRDQKGTG